MTPEKQRIAIAEACGWRRVPHTDILLHPHTDNKEVSYKISRGGDTPPDYLNDLNAMHEAEKLLTWGQSQDYWSHLLRVVNRDVNRPATEHSKDTFAFMATAAQRAEAFLRTIGKWEPEITA